MTAKQLQSLIAAGVFSASLMTGAAYAADQSMDKSAAPAEQTAPAKPDQKATKHHSKAKHSKTKKEEAKKETPKKEMKKEAEKTKKESAKHACAGLNSCKGQGGCATDGSKDNGAANMNLPKHACAGQNACKGQGGCATG